MEGIANWNKGDGWTVKEIKRMMETLPDDAVITAPLFFKNRLSVKLPKNKQFVMGVFNVQDLEA